MPAHQPGTGDYEVAGFNECESDEASAARHSLDFPMAPYIPSPDQLGHMHRNQRPRTPAVEQLLDEITERCLRLALWSERNVPHSPELAEALRPGGPLDELRGLLKAAVARRHPDQAAGSILPNPILTTPDLADTFVTTPELGERAMPLTPIVNTETLRRDLCHGVDLMPDQFERTSHPERVWGRTSDGRLVAVWTNEVKPEDHIVIEGEGFVLDEMYDARPGRFPNRYVLLT